MIEGGYDPNRDPRIGMVSSGAVEERRREDLARRAKDAGRTKGFVPLTKTLTFEAPKGGPAKNPSTAQRPGVGTVDVRFTGQRPAGPEDRRKIH